MNYWYSIKELRNEIWIPVAYGEWRTIGIPALLGYWTIELLCHHPVGLLEVSNINRAFKCIV